MRSLVTANNIRYLIEDIKNENTILNPYEEYLYKFGRNHGLTREQAEVHPMVQARKEVFEKTGK